MVQVDFFWSYALGAGLAMASARQLQAFARRAPTADDPRVFGPSDSLATNPHFLKAILYLALLFAPSGMYLLWVFPGWETMYVWDRDLSGLLVVLFGITNITQGMLGFWVVYRLLRAGRWYLAFLQMPLGYFCMFFILVHGWDGAGYRRFFSPDRPAFMNWSWWNALSFLVSDVAISLYVMGLILIPVLMAMMIGCLRQGYELGGADERIVIQNSFQRLLGLILQVILIGTLGYAIVAGLLIHLFGWWIGPLVFLAAAGLFALRKGAYFHRVAVRIYAPKENE